MHTHPPTVPPAGLCSSPLTVGTVTWSTCNVLVTGATGLVGARLVRHLIDSDARVTCFVRDHDQSSPLWFDGDIDRVGVATGRLECYEQVRAAIVERDIDTVFHLGAQAIVGVGQIDPMATFESNVRGTWHVLEACRLYGQRVKRIVVASSDKAYGECESLPYVESTALMARHPYDVSKCCADMIAQSFALSYGLPIAIARCGNIFGPGDVNWSRLIPGTIRSALRGEAPVIRSDGTLVRDYLHVDDAARAYMRLAEWASTDAGRGSAERAFNFSANHPLSVLAMTRMILEACDRGDLVPDVRNESKGEIRAQHLDSTRALRELGWSADADLRRQLRESAAWYRRYLGAKEPRARLRDGLDAAGMPRPARASA